jgi:LacI family transcriptional regulator, gluconate utilization system Gnt-I transcriptional repressor
MLSWRPSGVIIAGLEHTTRPRHAGKRGHPDRRDHGCGWRAGRFARSASRIAAPGARWPRRSLPPATGGSAFWAPRCPTTTARAKGWKGFEQALAEAGSDAGRPRVLFGRLGAGQGREMTEAILKRSPDLDFLYYSNDMIGAGGLLWCLEKGIDVPQRLGLAGFNGWSCWRVAAPAGHDGRLPPGDRAQGGRDRRRAPSGRGDRRRNRGTGAGTATRRHHPESIGNGPSDRP